MKAVFIENPGEAVIRRDIPRPARKPGGSPVKAALRGICEAIWARTGGRLHIFLSQNAGHEFSAEIVEIDENDRGLKPGMAVVCNPYFNWWGSVIPANTAL